MRSSQQTYIQRLGFQDKDRTNPRHQQACEYLLERIWQIENNRRAREYEGALRSIGANCVYGPGCAEPYPEPIAADCISVPLRTRYSVAGFADVLLYGQAYPDMQTVLGEVKITPEPAENVLQQLNFYRSICHDICRVYVVVDYDAPALQRLTAGSDISVYRLGTGFEAWSAARTTTTTTEEL